MGARVTRTFTCCDGDYEVTEYGNGWAYLVERFESGDNFYVQDGDADRFKEESEDFTNRSVIEQYLEAYEQ